VDAQQVGDRGRDGGADQDPDQEAGVLEEGEPESPMVAVAGGQDDRDQDREVDEVNNLSLGELGCRQCQPERPNGR
jgi:hypothetical protein